jgi:ornithine cyclodeaminase/alanine dehydrogenase-like protein (mu-crystallin family)
MAGFNTSVLEAIGNTPIAELNRHREGLVTREDIHGEFGAVVSGLIPGREDPDERIFSNPFGLAIEDIAVASAVYDQALSQGLGRTLQLVDQEWEVLF